MPIRTLAVLIALALAPAASAESLLLTVSPFTSVPTTVVNGTYRLQLLGTFTTIDLQVGVPLTLSLDTNGSVLFSPTPTSSAPPLITGEIPTSITVGGVSASFLYTYRADVSNPSAPRVEIRGPAAQTLVVGGRFLTVAPVDTTGQLRRATFTLGGLAPVPEPSSLAMAGVAVAALAGSSLRRGFRRRAPAGRRGE